MMEEARDLPPLIRDSEVGVAKEESVPGPNDIDCGGVCETLVKFLQTVPVLAGCWRCVRKSSVRKI